MEARLPKDKLSELKLLLQTNILKKTIKFKDFQSLLGHLNFACRVIKPVGWLVVLGLNDPLRQYFSLYRVVSKREGKREEKG